MTFTKVSAVLTFLLSCLYLSKGVESIPHLFPVFFFFSKLVSTLLLEQRLRESLPPPSNR